MPNQQIFYRIFGHNSKGFSLIEVLVALALLGIIAAAFLGGIATASKAMFIADERTTAESLARSQMEFVKEQVYDNNDDQSYEQPPVEHPVHLGYYISVDADPLRNPDDGIQKITVVIYHPYDALNPEKTKLVITLEDYKVDR